MSTPPKRTPGRNSWFELLLSRDETKPLLNSSVYAMWWLDDATCATGLSEPADARCATDEPEPADDAWPRPADACPTSRWWSSPGTVASVGSTLRCTPSARSSASPPGASLGAPVASCGGMSDQA